MRTFYGVRRRSLIEKTQRLLFTDRQDEFIASARKVFELISEHADKEEQLLFPLAERTLTTATANEVALKLQQADGEFGISQRELLMDMLNYLENKYIPKAA